MKTQQKFVKVAPNEFKFEPVGKFQESLMGKDGFLREFKNRAEFETYLEFRQREINNLNTWKIRIWTWNAYVWSAFIGFFIGSHL